MATIKLLHILFVFVWVGTLLTLTRLLAYLAKEPQSVQEPMAKIVKKIYFLVDLPSMILSICLGLTLLFLKETNWKAPWLHMKLTFAFLLIVSDLMTGYFIQSKRGGRKYAILHGVAGILFIGILIAIYIFKATAERNLESCLSVLGA